MTKRYSLVWGVILIVVGTAFLASQFIPGLFSWFRWPLLLIVPGGFFVLLSLVGRNGGLLIPGFVLVGLGGIFLVQDSTGDWDSWAYIWTLIPGLAGLGMLIGGLYDDETAELRSNSLWLIGGSLVAFGIFGGMFGLDIELLRFWPVLLIAVGVVFLYRSLRPQK